MAMTIKNVPPRTSWWERVQYLLGYGFIVVVGGTVVVIVLAWWVRLFAAVIGLGLR